MQNDYFLHVSLIVILVGIITLLKTIYVKETKPSMSKKLNEQPVRCHNTSITKGNRTTLFVIRPGQKSSLSICNLQWCFLNITIK